MATDQRSGSITPEPFAYFDPDSCSWKMCQGSLLEASGESCTTWPRQVTWDLQFVWELPTSAHLTDESESSCSRLLPTPDANYMNDGQSPEAYLERKRRELAKGYNGNGGGTTLAMTSRLLHEGIDPDAWKEQLLPTPGANDHTGGEGATRQARQEEGDTGGPALRDIAHLLPTPQAVDWKGGMGHQHMLSDAARAMLPTPTARDHKGSGQDPERAMRRSHLTGLEHRDDPTGQSRALLPTPNASDGPKGGPSRRDGSGAPYLSGISQLLPTPQAADGDGGRIDSAETTEAGKRPSGTKAALTLRTAITHKTDLLPTPMPDPSAGNGQGRATLAEEARLLPTPTGQDANQNALNEVEARRNPNTMWATMGRVHHGDHTSPRFGGGRQSSAGEPPDQLTIEDA